MKPESQPPDYVLGLERAHQELHSFLKSVRFNSKHLDHMLAVLYVGHVFELIESILVLHKSSTQAGVPVLGRSVFETAVRLAYLANDPRSAEKEHELEDFLERRKFHKNLLSAPKTDMTLNREQIEKLNQKIDVLEREGVKVLGMEARLSKLGVAANYPSFRFLSAFAHGQLTVLASRSVQFSTGVNQVELFRPLDQELERALFNALSQLTRDAAESAGRILELPRR